MIKKLHVYLITLLLLTSVGCDLSQNTDSSPELEGLYVLNEGYFQSGNASMTVYDPSSDSVEQNAFQRRNGRPLGNVGQSMTQVGHLLYVVINNSQQVEVMSAENLQSTGTIEMITPEDDTLSPRYMIPVRENIGYVTGWKEFNSPGMVSVVDLSTNEIIESMEVGVAPEQLAQVGNRVYVANSGGRTVTIIDSEMDEKIGTIDVAAQPAAVAVDASTRLWVLSRGSRNGTFGDTSDDTPGKLYMIDAGNGNKLDSLTIGLDVGSAAHPSGIALNNSEGVIYLRKGGIHKIDMNTLSLTEENFIPGNFYSLDYSGRSENQRIYVGDAKSFSGAGEAYIYDIQGTVVDSFQTAVGPGDFHVNISDQ